MIDNGNNVSPVPVWERKIDFFVLVLELFDELGVDVLTRADVELILGEVCKKLEKIRD